MYTVTCGQFVHSSLTVVHNVVDPDPESDLDPESDPEYIISEPDPGILYSG